MSFEVAHRTSVPADRLAGWLERFAAGHGQLVVQCLPDALLLSATDGALARLVNLWEPLPSQVADLDTALGHLTRPRTFGLLLVRKGADAVGVAEADELVAHRVSRHYVQARTKAGGWSQQRFARRRDNQARSAYRQAANDAFEVVVPHLPRLEALVTGGDRRALAEVLIDPRLQALARLPRRHPVLPVPDARLAVLADAVRRARSVPVELDARAAGQAPG